MLRNAGKKIVMNLAAGAATVIFPGMSVLAWAAAAPPKPLVLLRSGGAQQCLSDPNDAGLKRAFGMLSQRLYEIPDEVSALVHDPQADQAMTMAKHILPIVCGFLDYPLELTVNECGDPMGPIPNLDVRLVFDTGSKANADRINGSMMFLSGWAASEGVQSKALGGDQTALELPVGQIVFGPTNAGDGHYLIGYDTAKDGIDMSPVTVPTPEELGSTKLDWNGYVDLRGLVDMAGKCLTGLNNPQAQQLIATVNGFLPEGALDVVMGGGNEGEYKVTVIHAHGVLTVADNIATTFQPMLGPIKVRQEPLKDDVLKLIPEDARFACAESKDLSGLVGPLTMVAARIDVPELVPMFEALGKQWAFYMSDETGGGGLMSSVLVSDGVDANAMNTAMQDLFTAGNKKGQEFAHGYVRMHKSAADPSQMQGAAMEMWTLEFPGLPIPLSVSMAAVDHRWLLAATPQGLMAAVNHWRTGGPTLLDNANFMEAAKGLPMGKEVRMTFADVPASISKGYPIAQLLGSALGNFVRSPKGVERDPGLITPSIRQLREGAKASVSVTTEEGGDIIFMSHSDRSAMVRVAGTSGSIGMIPLAAAGIGMFTAMQSHHRHPMRMMENDVRHMENGGGQGDSHDQGDDDMGGSDEGGGGN